MSRRRLPLHERRAIRDRLSQFRMRHYTTRQAMNRDADVPNATAVGWFAPDPHTPDAAALVKLARQKNLNLNWLLLGEGTELRGIESPAEVWPLLRQTLVAELISHGATPEDAELLVPGAGDLFHGLLERLRLGWLSWKKTPLAPRRAGIGRALDRLLSGLDDLPARSPLGMRSLKRL